MVKFALQANLCYNKLINIVLPEDAANITQALINLFRRSIMDTIHPHAYFQQVFSFDEIDSPQVDQLQKICTGPCGKTLPATAEYFYRRNKSKNDGLNSRCKNCIEAYRKAHKKPRRDISRSSPINANCNRIQYFCDYCGSTAWDKPSSYRKKKRHFCSQKCYSSFRKELLPKEEHARWRGIGIDKQEYHRRYVKSHPDKIAHLKARRYAREKGAEGQHTIEEWNLLKQKFDNKCAICKKEKPLTKDHIIPLSRGGSDFIGNIQPLCRNCNSRKWVK